MNNNVLQHPTATLIFSTVHIPSKPLLHVRPSPNTIAAWTIQPLTAYPLALADKEAWCHG